MKITYHSHSCFQLDGENHSIIIDPFITDNPLSKITPEEIKVDTILVTHGHFDHVGDAVTISKRNKATIIAPFELANYFQEKGAESHPMHIGGGYDFPFGRVKLTIAHHGSTTESGAVGNPCGFVITMDNKIIYHAGDTGLFSDMKLIGELDVIDVALLPIGDNFTMGISDALKAVEFLHPKTVIPMHYNTFDVINQDPHKFVDGLKGSPTKGVVLEVEESLEI